MAGKFRNIILCEDVRDELGNKKSLMGILGGDILVPHFPAVLKIALYMEYVPESAEEKAVTVEFRILQDDAEIAKGKMEAEISPGQTANFILPQALISFEKDTVFQFNASVNGEAEEAILNKKVMKTPATS